MPSPSSAGGVAGCWTDRLVVALESRHRSDTDGEAVRHLRRESCRLPRHLAAVITREQRGRTRVRQDVRDFARRQARRDGGVAKPGSLSRPGDLQEPQMVLEHDGDRAAGPDPARTEQIRRPPRPVGQLGERQRLPGWGHGKRHLRRRAIGMIVDEVGGRHSLNSPIRPAKPSATARYASRLLTSPMWLPVTSTFCAYETRLDLQCDIPSCRE